METPAFPGIQGLFVLYNHFFIDVNTNCDAIVNPVTVYHGTARYKYLQILRDGKIKVTDEYIKNYPDTTCGFVYVTKRLCDAMDFSSRTAENGKSQITVFRIIIDESELLRDTDEAKWKSTLSPESTKDCYRIGRNLKIGKDVIAVFCKSFGTNMKLCGDFLQAIQYGEQEISEDKWCKL